MSSSGKFVLRIPPALHTSLRREAERQELSLNQLCIDRLTKSAHIDSIFAQTLETLHGIFKSKLVGVVVYGSWARGEANLTSDIDLLVVIEQSMKIDRNLYESWDSSGHTIEGHRIEAHIVAYPLGQHPSSLWAEVAMEGIVIYERDFAVSRYLYSVRKLVSQGKLIRRYAHGQPYWVHEVV